MQEARRAVPRGARRARQTARAVAAWALTASLAGALGALAPPPVAAVAQQIRQLRVVDTAEGARVEISGSAPLDWTMRFDAPRRLEVRIPHAAPVPDLAPVRTSSGLVSEVEFERRDGETGVATWVLVSTRAEVAAAVSARGDQLLVELSRRGEVVAPASQVETAGAPPAPAARGDNDARLGPGDVLEISVFGLPELGRKVRVARDGSVSLPLLGNFVIAGASVLEAERNIARMLAARRLVNDPQVSIFVEEFVSRTISVQGAVAKPGSYPMKGRSTLLDMLGAAGGLDDQHGDRILVLRTRADGTTSKQEIDSELLTSGGDAELNVVLEAGDIVMVPQARELRVYVTGAVVRPGPVDYLSSEGITVLQAITAAGGPTERANLGNVRINRRLPSGAQQQIKVNARRIQSGKAADVLLERNDTVVVGEWFF